MSTDRDSPPRDEELERWREEWTSLGDEATLAKDLVDRAARDGRRLVLSAAGEILGAVVSSSISLWLVVFTKGLVEVAVVTGVVLLFNGAWLTHFFTVRAGLFESSATGLDAFVALTRARLAAARRWNGYAAKWIVVITILLLPWSAWVFALHRAVYLAMPWRAAVGFGGWMAILAGLLVFLRRKSKRLRAEEERFERQVAEARLE